jgi:NADH dehydrogenase [ubiquinone] 1 alpha subcomplex assembly factor 7
MSRPVFDAVAALIGERGPITFADYMDLALYGPGGYYEQPPVGPRGDFVTSPHVHPVFGTFVADAVRAIWDGLGRPDPFHLIEPGAGDGTLLRQLLDELDDLPVRAIAVERSSGAREILGTIDGVTVLEHLPADGAGVVVAHELLDNLAFRRVRGTEDGPREVRITLADGALAEVLTKVDDGPGMSGSAADDPAPGEEALIPTGAVAFVLRALNSPDPRALLAIDYGTEHGAGGDVHGYRHHRVVDDLLGDPGETDITAGVDFGLLRVAVNAAGHRAFPTVSQREALTALGFEPWLLTQLERQGDLLNTGRGGDAVRTWGGRSRAVMLIDPAGLGRFRWFLATNVDIAEPPWLSDARAD